MKKYCSLTIFLMLALLLPSPARADEEQGKDFTLSAPSEKDCEYFGLDPAFYTKSIRVQDIFITSSAKVNDYALKESAYLFEKLMSSLDPAVAQRIRDKKVLCIVLGATEQLSEMPQFATQKTGEELDYYNWRGRGFLRRIDVNGREQPVFLYTEEDVLEYPDGMQDESILIHEFGHVVMSIGFSEEQNKKVQACYQNVKETGLYMDGYACLRYARISSISPVMLIDALAESFPDQPRALLEACLAGGDITVNGIPTTPYIKVDKDDKVLIHFGGPKDCYASKNPSEYWAEIYQDWYDTNRTMDHDHNHIHTRKQLKSYDPMGAALCAEVMGDGPWRFVSPRTRAGSGHLAGYDPASAPKIIDPENIRKAGLDFFDKLWEPYWQRLAEKYADELTKDPAP